MGANGSSKLAHILHIQAARSHHPVGQTLLRISVQEDGDNLVLGLEGRLVGPWVEELRTVWQQRASTAIPMLLTVDLCGLTSMDNSGRDLLGEMLQRGATLRCSDVMNQYLVEQMKTASGEMQEAYRPCQRFPHDSSSSEKGAVAGSAANKTTDAA